MYLNSKEIKLKARELGFDKIGISKAESTIEAKNNLEIWLSENKNAEMEWIRKRKEERGNIHSYYKDAKSIISVAMNYYTGEYKSEFKSDFHFSNYAWGEDYHLILKKGLFSLLKWLKKENKNIEGIVCTDTSPIMEKVWAKKSGLGWIGKHTNIITKDFGSWVFLGELILNIELDYDQSFNEDLCGTCSACIDSCPTQALEEYQIDSGKCISYLSIEKRGEFSKEDDLHDWIYGCDICQDVCPWNIKFSQLTTNQAFEPRDKIIHNTNDDWYNLTEDQFKELFKNSAVKRTKFKGLSRNIRKNKKKY